MNSSIDALNSKSVAELSRSMVAWLDLARSGAPVNELAEASRALIQGAFFMTLQVGDVLFRARVNSSGELFQNTSDLWHPPAGMTPPGRVNRAGSPMLYVGKDGRTALFEVEPVSGSHVTVARLEPRNDHSRLNLQQVGLLNGTIATEGLPDLTATANKDMAQLGYSKHGIENVWVLHRFLAEQFGVQDPDIFRLTTAIGEHLLTYHPADGVMYPSVQSPNDHNIAIRPDRAETNLRIVRLDCFRVGKAVAGRLSLQHAMTSSAIHDDGAVEWTDRLTSPQWPSIIQGVTTRVS